MRKGGPICEVLCRYGRVAEIDYQRDRRGTAINWGLSARGQIFPYCTDYSIWQELLLLSCFALSILDNSKATMTLAPNNWTWPSKAANSMFLFYWHSIFLSKCWLIANAFWKLGKFYFRISRSSFKLDVAGNKASFWVVKWIFNIKSFQVQFKCLPQHLSGIFNLVTGNLAGGCCLINALVHLAPPGSTNW